MPLPDLLARLPFDFIRRRVFVWALAHERLDLAKFLVPRLRRIHFKESGGYPVESSWALYGDGELVRMILARLPADFVKTWNDDGITLLHHAASNADSQVVALLLAQGADPGAKNWRGRTPLHEAGFEASRRLLEAGAEIDVGAGSIGTPLALAGWDSELTRLLLEQGADPESTDSEGITPLMKARNGEACRLLIAAGADVQRTDKKGRDALSHCSNNRGGEEVIADLIAAGADVGRRSSEGLPPMGYAILSHSQEYPAQVRALIEGGADLEDRIYKEGTALWHACLHAQLPVIGDLIEAGADVQTSSRSGQSLLSKVQEAISAAPAYFKPKLRQVEARLRAAGAEP